MKVINCGVNAYGTVQEWIMPQKQMPVERPRFVGLMFYENDFNDNVSGNWRISHDLSKRLLTVAA